MGNLVTLIALAGCIPEPVLRPRDAMVSDTTPEADITSSADRDWLAGTPWHKHVRARVQAVP